MSWYGTPKRLRDGISCIEFATCTGVCLSLSDMLLAIKYVTACSHFQAAIRFMIEAPVPRYFAINEATGNITLSKELNTSLETTFQVSDIMI